MLVLPVMDKTEPDIDQTPKSSTQTKIDMISMVFIESIKTYNNIHLFLCNHLTYLEGKNSRTPMSESVIISES